MNLSRICWRIFFALLVPAVVSTLLLYFYPAVLGCHFHTLGEDKPAPFRLLVLADPQLEGDSSLPNADEPLFPSLFELWTKKHDPSYIDLKTYGSQFFLSDIPTQLDALRKRVDLIGNDYYLAHIYRTLYWYTEPSHVTVLGDLLGSQWIDDGEFNWRGWRYWNRVFRHGDRVNDEIMTGPGREEILGADPAWSRRIINIAGNHDVGYAGDISEKRMERFERMFGKANWDVTFTLPITASHGNDTVWSRENDTPMPAIRLIILNSMNLDGPALAPAVQSQTYEHINSHFIAPSRPVEDKTTFTLLLTHIPLHKTAGVCVDAPYFSYWPSYDDEKYEGNVDQGNNPNRRKFVNIEAGGIKEQNHLSEQSSRNILEGIFGMSTERAAVNGGIGRKGVILTGHDHEGCDVVHHVRETTEDEGEERSWAAVRMKDFKSRMDTSDHASESPSPNIREITLRSMMGAYSGNAGLLSAWFDAELGEWDYAFETCALGVQHWWWGVHILDLVTVCIGLVGIVTQLFELTNTQPATAHPGESIANTPTKGDVKSLRGQKIVLARESSAGDGIKS
jgi:hypothetical protein